MFQRPKSILRDMENSEQINVENGDNDEAVNTRMEANERLNLTLDEIAMLNEKGLNNNAGGGDKNNDEDQDEFADYLKFSIEIVKAIEKAEENKGWDRRPVKVFLPEGRPINILIAGETTDKELTETLENSFGKNSMYVGIRNKKNQFREPVIEWKIKDLEEAKKTIGIIFR